MPTIIQRKCQITECQLCWDVNGKGGVNLLFCYSKHIVLQKVFVKGLRIPFRNIVYVQCAYNITTCIEIIILVFIYRHLIYKMKLFFFFLFTEIYIMAIPTF